MSLSIGIDIGSTTVKFIVLKNKKIIYKTYKRHFSKVQEATLKILESIKPLILSEPFTLAFSGSAALGLASNLHLPFVQEVFATCQAAHTLESDTDVIIELGGEDAKILFLTGGTEERMNGSCAGGTGAFIDQMAALLNITALELDALSLNYTQLYPIASRCGVFAKTDIQPLLNQGARKEDLAASIFQAVVDQTITGLSQGRSIKGKVMFLGGPLHFFKGLGNRFKETLNLDDTAAVFPELGLYSVALGSALFAEESKQTFTFDSLYSSLKNLQLTSSTQVSSPLFATPKDYDDFLLRHSLNAVPTYDLTSYSGNVYIGIDCGSTTTKLVVMSENDDILYQFYSSNKGTPIDVVKEQLLHIYSLCNDSIHILSTSVTGYGEEIIKHTFNIDFGLVETLAHLQAAKHFNPKVDYILDIGGQDIKCFKIKDGMVDDITLNEACSSGCGSFIETFAKSLGYDIETFAELALESQAPVELGSRCTVFMNSSVKQAQKDGASIADLSAGLALSVVKNALYKVIRSTKSLGEQIVVQGGTFLNDAVLRSFELEIGQEVIRPNISGIMGAYGAALYAKTHGSASTTLIPYEALKTLTHKTMPSTCKGCTNKCTLTINTLSDHRRLISGGRCEKPTKGVTSHPLPDLYKYKLEQIANLKSKPGKRGKIGIPLGLNIYEMIHFFHPLLTSLGFEVVLSDLSSKDLYRKGQHSIPSDTVCYPAKLMHGHIIDLLDKGISTLFYPCLTYNFDEHLGNNHFNCPVVAYYPEVLKANMEELQNTTFLTPYWYPENRKNFILQAYKDLKPYYPDLTRAEIRQAVTLAYQNYAAYKAQLYTAGERALEFAKIHHKQAIILAGRPYHIDPEINHGINSLLSSLDIVVLSEDCIPPLHKTSVHVLNQWTYHSRLYNCAKHVSYTDDLNLIHFVSFGCGIDAITCDQVSEILAENHTLYTQIKCDEITNLGAVKIRIRSLLEALKGRSEAYEKYKS